MNGKSPAEIERANRMFAVENAVKLGYENGAPTPIESARSFFEFLQENEAISDTRTGFTPNS
jgi:hypothetical protein